MEVENIVAIITIILATLPQIAALIGKPKWAERVEAVSKAFDLLAGNYGKARNK